MKNIQSFFEPFGIVSKSKMLMLVFIQIILVLGLWQWLGGGLIPSPGKIGMRILEIIKSGNFWDNFILVCNNKEGLANLLKVSPDKVASWPLLIKQNLEKAKKEKNPESKETTHIIDTGMQET